MKPEKLELTRQGRIEEYKALREEMLYALRSRVWGLVAYAALAWGLFGLLGKDQLSIAALVTLLLAIPFVWYTTYLERMRCRIADYIRVVIEPQVPGLEWGDYLSYWRDQIREEKGWRRHLGRWRYILSMLGVYDIVAIVCLCIAWAESPLWPALGATVGAVLIAHDHLRLTKVLSAGEEYRAIFRHKRKSGAHTAGSAEQDAPGDG
jgi:hypothetical protein